MRKSLPYTTLLRPLVRSEYLHSNFEVKKIFRYLIVTSNVWMRIQKGIGTIVYYAASILLRRAFLSRLQAKKPTWIQETFCPSYFYWLYHHSLFTFRPATKQCCQKSFNQVNETFFLFTSLLYIIQPQYVVDLLMRLFHESC